MSGLERDTHAFLEAALEADRPKPEDRARVRAKLAAQMGVPLGVDPSVQDVSAPASTSASTGLAGGAAGSSGGLVFAAVAALVSVGAAVAYFGAEAEVPAPASPTLELLVPVGEPVPSIRPPEPALPIEPSTPARPESTRPFVRSPERAKGRVSSGPELAEEARLMAEVQLALRDDEPQRALALLDEYRSRFPRGSLRVEGWAARALASCALERTTDAEQSRARVAALAPSSPLLVRIDAACGWEEGSDE